MIDFSDANPHVHAWLYDFAGDGQAQPFFNLGAIKARLADTACIWIPDHYRNAVMEHGNRSMRVGDLDGTAGESAVLHLEGERAGCGKDFASDDWAGPIDLLGRATGLRDHELYEYAANIAGVTAVTPHKAPKKQPVDLGPIIERILNECVPLTGTPGLRYIQQSRKIPVAPSDDLKFCGSLYDGDSKQRYIGLVAIVRDKYGQPMQGIHRTFLLPDGSTKALPGKKMLGSVAGGAVRLLPMGPDGHMGIAEGIETALAAARIFFVPTWAALSTTGLVQWQWPDDVRNITIFADAGEPGKKAANELRERIIAAGIECRIRVPLHGDDFNDDLAKGRKAEDYQEIEKQPVGWTYENFLAYLPMNKFICVDTRDLWPAESVNSQLPWKREGKADVPPSRWLLRRRAVQQMTWAPGHELTIQDKIVSDGGFIDRPDCRVFNLYRPPIVKPGNPKDVRPWLDHLERVYPDEFEELVCWFAHRAQFPGEKINHALVLGGVPGIGKDTILEPVKYAIGNWNFQEASPQQVLGRFNGFLRSVILRISEARDLGEIDRFGFYDHMKTYTAAPPDVLRCDEKNIREHSILNVTGVIHTTNYKTDGLYLPADDRRHFVCWSEVSEGTFSDDYWTRLYSWYGRGGLQNVAAYLQQYDLSEFDAKRPPRKTDAFKSIVDANRSPEDSELADVIDALGNPHVLTIDRIISVAPADLAEWIRNRSNRRKIPHRLQSAGYVPVRNDDDKRDGQWKIKGKRQTVYGKLELNLRERISYAISYVVSESR
jgi:hypothetical protein